MADFAGHPAVVGPLGEDVPGWPGLFSLRGRLGAELVGRDTVSPAQLVDDALFGPDCLGLFLAPCHGGLIRLRDALGGRLLPPVGDLNGGEAGLQLAGLALTGRPARRSMSARIRARRSPAYAAAVIPSRIWPTMASSIPSASVTVVGIRSHRSAPRSG